MKLFDIPPFQPTVISFPLLGLSCTFRSLSSYRTASYPYIPTPSSPSPHTELCLVVFNGGGFRSASEVLSCQEEKQQEDADVPLSSWQGSPRCFDTSFQDGAPRLFGALTEQSGFRSHCEGLATLSEHKRPIV